MSMIDSFFNKGFKAAKCKTLLKLTIPRIKLLRNRREIQIKQMRRDIAKLLETGQEATARIRVEHIIREEKMMAAQEILELFCELITVRLPIIEAQRECPLDLKEAISSVCFAAPRCADLPELIQCQMLFAAKYGREFVAAATELMPDCSVNRQLIELLSVRAPPPEDKMKLLKEIAEEHNLDWDPSASEAELFKSHEDLLSGSTQFVSGSKLPLPKEKHDESVYDRPEHADEEEPDSDSGLDTLDFPDVPIVSIRANANAASAPEIISSAPAHHVHPSSQEPSKFPVTMEEIFPEKHVELEEAVREHQVDPNDIKADNFVGPKEDKQFLPFISPPSLSSESIAPAKITPSPSPSPDIAAAEHYSHPGSLSRTKSEADNVDLGDVLAAAQAAAESAERAAAAARSAASLAQLRISELTRKNSVQDPNSCCDNPFHTDNPDQAADARNHELDHQKSLDGSEHSITPPSKHPFDGDFSGPISSPSVEAPKFDANMSPSHSFHEHNPPYHQPQRLPSMDEDYMSYPNLFSSHDSFTEKSRSYHDQ